jgi:hypothetical protein
MGNRKQYPEACIMCVEENGEAVIYIECDGKRIAQRPHRYSTRANVDFVGAGVDCARC